MYFNYNDYELIYLIKEGVDGAYKELVKKYTHLLRKVHKANFSYVPVADFIQEGLMILSKSVETYDMSQQISFYAYYHICLNRRLNRVYIRKKIATSNLLSDNIKDKNNYSTKYRMLIKELTLEDSGVAEILDYCVIRGMSVKRYCKLLDKCYEKEYYRYKKIIKDLRKKVD